MGPWPGELGEKREERREKGEEKRRGKTAAGPRMVTQGWRGHKDGEAQVRVDWKRNGWPDAKIEVTSAKCDLRKEQQREKREESRERREKREESREG